MSELQGILLFLTVVVMTAYLTRDSKEKRQKKEDTEVFGQIIRHKLLRDGSLVEDVMLACEKDTSLYETFSEFWKLETVEEKRAEFCRLCLSASGLYYDIECAPLSKEFLSAYRAQISLLPQDFRRFYRSGRSVYEINPDDALIASLSAHHYHSGHVAIKTKIQKQEDLIFWNEIFLPEDEKLREKEIDMLLFAFNQKQLAFRFKKKQSWFGNGGSEVVAETAFK